MHERIDIMPGHGTIVHVRWAISTVEIAGCSQSYVDIHAVCHGGTDNTIQVFMQGILCHIKYCSYTVHIEGIIMYHKISDLTRKVSAMYDLSLRLHRMKYDTPAHAQDHILIDNLVLDIQQLAGDIFNDRQPYSRNIDVDFESAAV